MVSTSYLHIVGVVIVCGVDARSLVGIFNGGKVAAGCVGYDVGSALKGSSDRHIVCRCVVVRYEKVGGGLR